MKYKLFAFILLVSVFSCKDDYDNKVLAEVYGDILYEKDIIENIYNGVNDSAFFKDKFIDKWVRKQILLHHANVNIDNSEPIISDAVKKYEQSLLIYEYQQQLINQNFDTTININELYSYYEKNKNQYKLRMSVFKGRFIIIDKFAPNIKRLFKIYRSNNLDDIDEMINYCQLYANEFHINDTSWTYFDPLKNKLPNINVSSEYYLRNSRFDVFENENLLFLVDVKSYKIKGTVSPFVVEKEKIKSLLLNRKKIIYLNQLEDDLIINGLAIEKIKIY